MTAAPVAAGRPHSPVRAERPRPPVARLLRLARPVWPRLGYAGLAGAAAAGAGVALMATSAWLISRAAQHPPVLYLMVAIVAVRAFGLSRGVLRYAERLAGHDAALRILTELRVRTYARLARLVPAGVPDLRDGDLVARFAGDVDAALDVVVRAVLPQAVNVVIGLASVLMLGALLPAAGLAVAVALLAVVVGVPRLHSLIARRAEARAARLRGRLAEQTVTLLRQLPDAIAYDATGPAIAALTDTDARLARTARTGAAAAGAGSALASLAAGGCAVAGLVLTAGAVAEGRLNPVLVAVIVLTPLAVFDALSGLPAATAALRTGRAALTRVFAVLDRDDPVPDPARPEPNPAPTYHLRLRGVTARWPGGPEAFTAVDLDLPQGSRTAVVGPSGAGKSTLAALLTRMLDPVTGTVTLGGTDLRDLTGDQVRAVVGLVDDRAYLFDATIAVNLRVGAPDASDARLREALAAAHLAEWVATLPRGLDTPVGEHGARLSGGQRRRLALARALLADRPVLILDEPAEHLDEATATALTRNFLAAAGNRTVVLITHRPVAGLPIDRIVHVAAGTVHTAAARMGRPSLQRPAAVTDA